ncbi:MAG: tetratricopeptide repeat protein [Ignavibacteriales bacterium]|nr:tetratricopeptide repeat protein [Ignavibacteriales bacterium]
MKSHYDVKDFAAEVINKSFNVPVLVDFWAEWCAPCKMLGPILERLAEKADGRWILAKVDTEKMPEVAVQYKISSIPNVKLFVDGNAIAEFVGAVPEYQIERWLEQVLPSKFLKEIEKAADLLAQGNTEEGKKLLEEILKSEPENQQAKVLLASAIIFSEPEKAGKLVADISDAEYLEIAEALKTFERILQLKSEDLDENPVKQKYLSAIADLRSQKFDEALEKFINVIRGNRHYDDDGSRKACIAIFKFLGEEHETTLKYRREFSSALY